MTQRQLFAETTKRPTAERFKEFIEHHRWFTREVVKATREYKARGMRVGMKKLFEDFRHQFPRGPGKYGLDNSYSSYMARHVMTVAPDLKGYFEVR